MYLLINFFLIVSRYAKLRQIGTVGKEDRDRENGGKVLEERKGMERGG